MSWGKDFVATFDRLANPMAGLRAAASPPLELSPAELAAAYSQVVQPGETAVKVAHRLKGALEVAAMDVSGICNSLVAIEQAIVAAQKRNPPTTMQEAGGFLLASDFTIKVLSGEIPEHGPRPLILGAINSLARDHWCRDVLGDDDWYKSSDGPCVYIGDGALIHINEAVSVTKQLRQVQRAAEEEYRREQEQSELRARRQWEQSPEGQIQALRREFEEYKKRHPVVVDA